MYGKKTKSMEIKHILGCYGYAFDYGYHSLFVIGNLMVDKIKISKYIYVRNPGTYWK